MENQGRVNFGPYIADTAEVSNQWVNTQLKLTKKTSINTSGPCCSVFTVDLKYIFAHEIMLMFLYFLNLCPMYTVSKLNVRKDVT